MSEVNANERQELLQALIRQYAAQGYEVSSESALPTSVRETSAADLVLKRGDETVVVEVRRAPDYVSPRSDSDDLNALAEAVARYPKLRLDVVAWPDPVDLVPDQTLIAERATRASALATEDDPQLEAGLLLAGASLEGALLILLRRNGLRARSDDGLGELLAEAWSEGLLTKTQWERAQASIARRNAVAHGLAPAIQVDVEDVHILTRLALLVSDVAFTEAIKLVEWFFERYKSPADGVPFDSKEGGYIYTNGGPFDAETVLREEFAGVPEAVMDEAVDQIQSYGDGWVRVDDY